MFLGGNDSYIAMCHACWRRRIARETRRTDAEREAVKLYIKIKKETIRMSHTA